MKDLLEQLQQLAPLAAAATEGPWKQVTSSSHVSGKEVTYSVYGPYSDFMYLRRGEDAAFIAAARNLLTPENLTRLVAALEGAQAQEVTEAQRDGAMLYAEACEKRLHQLMESAMQPLPSYEEMMAAAAATLKGADHV